MPHLFETIHPHALPDRLHYAAMQLSASIQAGEFAASGQDIECRLRGFVIFLCNAEEAARTIVAELRLRGSQ